MKISSLLLSLFLLNTALANEIDLSSPPPRPAKLEPVEGECEIAFSLILNRPVPSFFLHDDGTLNCHAIAVPRSQAGNAILMADWAENLAAWHQLDVEVRDAELKSLQSSHQLEVARVRKNARTEGMAIGAGAVVSVLLTVLLISL